ncbi:hypothetical protein FRC11_007959, partial [Ceratobasidium sp. 423]
MCQFIGSLNNLPVKILAHICSILVHQEGYVVNKSLLKNRVKAVDDRLVAKRAVILVGEYSDRTLTPYLHTSDSKFVDQGVEVYIVGDTPTEGKKPYKGG